MEKITDYVPFLMFNFLIYGFYTINYKHFDEIHNILIKRIDFH